MERRKVGVLSAILLLYIPIIGLSCAISATVTGGGSVPTIDTNPPSLPSPLDPSQYVHPNLPIIPASSGSSSSGAANLNNQSSNIPTVFSMTSRVQGSSIGSPAKGAAFSEWRCVESDNGFKGKQTSSALSGSLDEARIIIFYSDQQSSGTENSSAAALLWRDTTAFLGNSYNDQVSYLNKGDSIRNRFSGGIISKNFTYIGTFENYRNNNLGNESGHFDRSTKYNLDSKIVGITDLDLISVNENKSSEISEQYSGKFAISINFKSALTYSFNTRKDEWLPCCLDGWAGMQEQDNKYSNAARIFDCTCN